jgi:hypothetical protein
MHPDVIDAFYRFVASGSTSEPQIFWQGRNGPLLGKQVLEWSTMPQASRPRVSDQRSWVTGQASPSLIVWVLRLS